MRAMLTTAELALAVALLAITLSSLRSGRMPARMRSWVFFSLASCTLLLHAALDALALLPDVAMLFDVVTLALLALGMAFLYGSDQVRVSKLEGSSQRDEMTKLYNRQAFRELVEERLRKAPRRSAVLAILDLDGFKRVNDEFGHPRGDDLLRLVAAALRANLRDVDLAARYGGDEFVVYFDGCVTSDAERILQRIRASVRSVTGLEGAAVTVSAGVAGYPEHAEDVDGLVRAADGALLAVKRAGKDQVSLAR